MATDNLVGVVSGEVHNMIDRNPTSGSGEIDVVNDHGIEYRVSYQVARLTPVPEETVEGGTEGRVNTR